MKADGNAETSTIWSPPTSTTMSTDGCPSEDSIPMNRTVVCACEPVGTAIATVAMTR